MIGKTISHYKILKKLGEGGMGVVYEAEDTKLRRTVALKFLPRELMKDEESKKRFLREAQAASALDHPNICTIHEIDQSEDGRMFISMASYQGITLKQRIAQGPLPIGEAVDIVNHVSRGLKKAHDEGIIHRDIKSSNIILTKDGTVKILDFGLAKLQKRATTTKPGSAMGTVAYMSPEQALGKSVDHRTDIFSLGVVLYEMIAGAPPFQGRYDQAVVYSIVNEEPAPLTSLRTDVPVALETVVDKMLAKDPGARYQHVEEVPVDLGALDLRTAESAFRMPPPGKHRRQRPKFLSWKTVPILAFLIFSIIVLFRLRWLRFEPPLWMTEPISTFPIILPPETELYLTDQDISTAISPDGKTLVFTAMCKGISQLYLHRVGQQLDSEPIPGTENGKNPFFSPDGQWIGFFSLSHLWRVHIGGGRPIPICRVLPYSKGASWGKSNRIIFAPSDDGGLYSISAWIESEQLFTEVAQNIVDPDTGHGEEAYLWPQVLPDGMSILFIVRKSTPESSSPEKYCLAITDKNTSESIVLSDIKMPYARYLKRTGKLLFVQGGKLFTMPFSPEHPKQPGIAEPMMDIKNVYVNKIDDIAQFTVSDRGRLIYIPEDFKPKPTYSLVWVDGNSNEQGLMFTSGVYRMNEPRISPTGDKIALVIIDQDNIQNIHILGIEDEHSTPISIEPATRLHPVWDPDGIILAYTYVPRRPMLGLANTIFIKDTKNMSAQEEQLITQKHAVKLTPNSWSPDGHILAYILFDGKQNDIWLYNGETGGSEPWMIDTLGNESDVRFSPCGKWLAYVSDMSGKKQVYVSPFDNPLTKWPVSKDGGSAPVWHPNKTNHILYYRKNKTLMRVEYDPDPQFTITPSTPLFERYFIYGAPWEYDISSLDGRFLTIKRKAEATQLVCVNLIL